MSQADNLAALGSNVNTSGVLQPAGGGTGTTTATGTGSVVLSSGATLTNATINGAVASGFTMKNRIINGDMVIDQRNAGASVTVSNATITYITDRWNIYEDTSGAISAQQSTIAPTGFTNSFLTTVTSAGTATSGQLCRLQQRIEGLNISDLSWGSASAQTITISFWVRSSLTGTYCVNIRNSATDRSYVATYTISTANTWEQKSVTIAGDTSGTWLTTNGIGMFISWDLGSGSNANTTAGSWVAGNKENTSAQANWIGTSGATFYITGVQLEQGSAATSFEWIPYGMELALCQRYYVNWGSTYQAVLVSGVAVNTLTHPVTMRVAPTATSAAPGFSVPVNTTVSMTIYSSTTGGYSLTTSAEL